jgi:hypothetical protein
LIATTSAPAQHSITGWVAGIFQLTQPAGESGCTPIRAMSEFLSDPAVRAVLLCLLPFLLGVLWWFYRQREHVCILLDSVELGGIPCREVAHEPPDCDQLWQDEEHPQTRAHVTPMPTRVRVRLINGRNAVDIDYVKVIELPSKKTLRHCDYARAKLAAREKKSFEVELMDGENGYRPTGKIRGQMVLVTTSGRKFRSRKFPFLSKSYLA